MASFQGTRFPGPMFNQNFPRNNFNMNPGVDRHPGPQFQRPPNVPYRPFQPPERFMHGFQNRPQFSNFPEPVGASGFINRPPPPVSHPPPPVSHPPPPSHPSSYPPPPSHPSYPPPPSHPSSYPPSHPSSYPHLPPPHQVFRMNSPPPVPRPRYGGSFERPFRPWNQMSTFRGPRSAFQNRPRAPVPNYRSKDLPLQLNKKRKQKTREFRKLKDDTTEKPFSCDTCDRAFVTENELKDHISQHIQCDHENCTFEAHPKVVGLHKKMQHDTGYADTINKLKDDAEIKKWREERRRRFPTAENIKKRQAEQAEKEARGEVLETKEFGKFKRRKEGNGNIANTRGKRIRGRRVRQTYGRRNFENHPCSRPFTIKVDSESDSDSDSHIILNMFLGMSSLTNSANKKCNQNEDVEVTSSPHSTTDAISEKHQFSSPSSWKQNLPKSNSDNNISRPDISYSDNNSANGKIETPCLLNGEKLKEYKSHDKPSASVYISNGSRTNHKDYARPADESVCEIPEDEIEKPITELVDIEDSDDGCPAVVPVTKCIMKSVVDNKVQETVPPVIDALKVSEIKNQKDTTSGYKYLKKHQTNINGLSEKQDSGFQARKSTLLEKLLADDIRHERNVVLQCIRHIVNNNFFGIGAKKS